MFNDIVCRVRAMESGLVIFAKISNNKVLAINMTATVNIKITSD